MYLNKKNRHKHNENGADRGTVQQAWLHYLQLVVHKNELDDQKRTKQWINKHISESPSVDLYGFFKVENPKFRPMSIKLSVGQIRPSLQKHSHSIEILKFTTWLPFLVSINHNYSSCKQLFHRWSIHRSAHSVFTFEVQSSLP